MVRGGTISHTPRWLVAAYRHRISDSPPEDGTGLPAHLAVARPEGHGQAKGILPAHRDMPEAGGVSVPVVEMDALALAAGMQQGVCVAVDLRPSSAWEGGHIPGAIPLRDAGLFRWLPDLFARYAMQRRLARLLRRHAGSMLVFCSEAAATCPDAGRGCLSTNSPPPGRGGPVEGGSTLATGATGAMGATGCPCLAHRWLGQALLLGARNVAMLCGGMAAWRAAGLPLLHGRAAGDMRGRCTGAG